MQNFLIAVLTVAGLGFFCESKANAQGYTVYIANINNQNAGWVRSGTAGETFTTKQACINAIAKRVADNKRFRNDWETFAVVRTTCRPAPGKLNLTNVPCGWSGQIRYWPANSWYNVTVSNIPARIDHPTSPNRSGLSRPEMIREERVIA